VARAKVAAASAVEAKASAAEARVVGAKVEVLASHAVSPAIVPVTALRVAEDMAVARARAVEAKVAPSLVDSGSKAVAPSETAAVFRTTDPGQVSKDNQGFGAAASKV